MRARANIANVKSFTQIRLVGAEMVNRLNKAG